MCIDASLIEPEPLFPMRSGLQRRFSRSSSRRFQALFAQALMRRVVGARASRRSRRMAWSRCNTQTTRRVADLPQHTVTREFAHEHARRFSDVP